MQSAVVLGVSAADRWLLTFAIATAVVLVLSLLARRAAQDRSRRAHGESGGYRRRAGAAVALGPAIGLLLAPDMFGVRAPIAVAVAGAVALAVVGWFVERSEQA